MDVEENITELGAERLPELAVLFSECLADHPICVHLFERAPDAAPIFFEMICGQLLRRGARAWAIPDGGAVASAALGLAGAGDLKLSEPFQILSAFLRRLPWRVTWRALPLVFSAGAPARPGERPYEVVLLATTPDRRGRGLATGLIEHLSGEAEASDCTCLSVAVANGSPAVGFYGRRGFGRQGSISVCGRELELMTRPVRGS